MWNLLGTKKSYAGLVGSLGFPNSYTGFGSTSFPALARNFKFFVVSLQIPEGRVPRRQPQVLRAKARIVALDGVY